MLIRRAHAAVVLAVVAGLALSGCSIVTDGERVWTMFQEEEAAKSALNDVVAALKELDGVIEASSVFDKSGPGSLEAEIAVTARPDATVAQLRAVAGIASEALEGEVLSPRTRTFTLSRGGTMLTQSQFGLESGQLADEVEYWVNVQEVIGDEILLAVMEPYTDATYRRELRAVTDSPEKFLEMFVSNYDTLLAVPDPAVADSFWVVPGLISRGLPPAEVIDLVEGVGDVMPLRDPSSIPESPPPGYVYPLGAMVQWGSWRPGQQAGTGVLLSQDEYRASDWPGVVTAAALSASVRPLTFEFQTAAPDNDPMGFRQFRFFTEACGGTVEASDDDRALVDAMVAIGITLPEGGGAGMCHVGQQPAP